MEYVRKDLGAETFYRFYNFFFKKNTQLHDFKSKIILINSYIDLQKLDMFRKNNGFGCTNFSRLLATVEDRASKIHI